MARLGRQTMFGAADIGHTIVCSRCATSFVVGTERRGRWIRPANFVAASAGVNFMTQSRCCLPLLFGLACHAVPLSTAGTA
jgi:hypothetical protein